MHFTSPPLLGLPGPQLPPSSDKFISKLGGISFKPFIATCKCSKSMKLVLQLYAPTDELDRWIWLFCCCEWKCFRESVKVTNENKPTKLDLDFNGCSLNELELMLEDNHISAPIEPRTHISVDSACDATLATDCYESVELISEIEPNPKPKLNKKVKYKIESDAFEHYEGTLDQSIKFVNRVHICPKQCLRVDYAGKPLLYRNASANVVNCACGGKRIFEAQLMPNVLNMLPLTFDFATILIYTCEKDCSGICQEYIVVQKE